VSSLALHDTLFYNMLSSLLNSEMLLRYVLKYRSRTDIIEQVLDAANGGATKTKIMYNAYLSYAQLKEYLSNLTENGLLEYIETDRKYRTTEKGSKFLKIYGEMSGVTGDLKQVTI
jgi:predicted transcriptional regulator